MYNFNMLWIWLSREEKFSDELQIASFFKLKLENCWITSEILKSINADNTARLNISIFKVTRDIGGHHKGHFMKVLGKFQ